MSFSHVSFEIVVKVYASFSLNNITQMGFLILLEEERGLGTDRLRCTVNTASLRR